MRLHSFLHQLDETMTPHYDKKYLKARIKQLTWMASVMVSVSQAYQTMYDTCTPYTRREIDYTWCNSLDQSWETWNVLELFMTRLNPERYESITRAVNEVAEIFESILKFGSREFKRYIPERLKRLKDILNNIDTNALQEWFDHYQEFMEKCIERGTFETDEELASAQAWIDKQKTLKTIMAVLPEIIKDIEIRYEEFTRLDNSQFGDGKFAPEHGDTEIAYHVTVYADLIASEGFQAEAPDSRRGLGFTGAMRKTVSFTFRPNYAQQILRAMREMWMIAHAKLTAPQILEMCHKDGVDVDTVLKSFFDRMGKKDIRQLSPENTAYLFTTYLAFTTKRMNPGFAGEKTLIQELEQRPYNGLGIIEAELDLSGKNGKDYEYFPAEYEFRVSPNKIKSFKRVA